MIVNECITFKIANSKVNKVNRTISTCKHPAAEFTPKILIPDSQIGRIKPYNGIRGLSPNH